MTAPMTASTSPDEDVILAALADVVVEYDLVSHAAQCRVRHGLPRAFPTDDATAMWTAWVRLIAPDHRRRVVEGLRLALVSGQRAWMETYDVRRLRGPDATVEHRVIVLPDAQGRAARLVHVVKDASERRRAEELLQEERRELGRRVEERTRALAEKNTELARAMRHKDAFLASMSHELRTPLNAVLGLSDALLEGVGGPLADKQRAWVGDIAASGRHLLRVINDILDLARIEAGKLEVDVEDSSPEEISRSTMQMMVGAAMARGIILVPTIASDLPMLRTDPRLLRQVLINLLGNAIKFTPMARHVDLIVRAGPHPGTVDFEVRDEGVGIPDGRLAEIFKPFVQLDPVLTRDQDGSGLGLALASRMVELLGGSIKVTSKVGVGSTFTVTVGSLNADARRTEEIPVTGPDPVPLGEHATHTGRVLLAEDNAANVRTFRRYLEAKGFDVEVAEDGQQAVEKFLARKHDIILMDVQMPRMDGLQATRLIREHPTGATVPIIALTALAMPGDRDRCLAAGANEYVAKPVRLRELVDRMAALRADVTA